MEAYFVVQNQMQEPDFLKISVKFTLLLPLLKASVGWDGITGYRLKASAPLFKACWIYRGSPAYRY
jgi:hypothetical protein